MSKNGIRFDRFYSGAPVCSPTRGSCLTGRHPYRYGIYHASIGNLREQEITLAEALKTQGYTTGHFGKWHLGFLSSEKKDDVNYSPPDQNGFDEWYSTLHSVPTWDPWQGIKRIGKSESELDQRPNEPWKSCRYYHNGEPVNAKLEGDDSAIIINKAIPFIRKAVKAQKAFFAVIWFHAPHGPVYAGPKYRQMYADCPSYKQHYYGCITAIDEQIGRLRNELRNLDVADNTMIWFCSDNGPEYFRSRKFETDLFSKRHSGTAGPYRGKKRSLFEGGIRVPGLLEWPAKIKKPVSVDIAASTSDYYPTICDLLDIQMKDQPKPIDGVSLLPLIEGKMTKRPGPICFESEDALAVIDNRYKLVKPGRADLEQQAYLPGMGTGRIGSIEYAEWWFKINGSWPVEGDGDFLLFDLIEDPYETKDLAAQKPDVVEKLKVILENWRESCRKSYAGEDYKQ
jgi:arylsulfatase A-like enzyme